MCVSIPPIYSCMVRGCPAALVAFRQADGLHTLVAMLEGNEPRVQRWALAVAALCC